jgi:hypothetical protein
VPFDHDALEPAEMPDGYWRWSCADSDNPVPGALPYNLHARLGQWVLWDYPAGRDNPGAYCCYYDSREDAMADLRFALGECRRDGADPSR